MSSLNSYINQWSSLCEYGSNETSLELSDCKWNDDLCKRIKEEIEDTVNSHLRSVLDSEGREISSIDVSDIEYTLSKIEEDL